MKTKETHYKTIATLLQCVLNLIAAACTTDDVDISFDVTPVFPEDAGKSGEWEGVMQVLMRACPAEAPGNAEEEKDCEELGYAALNNAFSTIFGYRHGQGAEFVTEEGWLVMEKAKNAPPYFYAKAVVDFSRPDVFEKKAEEGEQ